MHNPPWDLDFNEVEERPVERAALLSASRAGIIMLDPDEGRFTRLPGSLDRGGRWPAFSPFALSPDGRRLLLGSASGPQISLVIQTLATGHRQELPTPPGCFDTMAAFSPDGGTVASLVNDDRDGPHAAVDLITLSTGARHRAWSAEGTASGAEALIAWSPDGRHIAVTYVERDSEETATVILDAAAIGSVGATHTYRILQGSPNAAWVDDNHVVLLDSSIQDRSTPFVLLEMPAGDVHGLAALPRHARRIAFFGGRCLVLHREGRLDIADLDGAHSETIVTLPAGTSHLGRFDIVPSLLH